MCNLCLLNRAREIAKEKNWTCLSNNCINKSDNADWQCNVCQYKWSSPLRSTNIYKICPNCLAKQKAQKRLEDTKNMGFICLTEEQLNFEANKIWQYIKCGHIIEDKFYNLKFDNKCNECYSNELFEEAKMLISENKQTFVSVNIEPNKKSKFFNTITTINIICEHNLPYKTDLCSLRIGRRCSCYKNEKYTIEEAREIVEKMGGTLLSKIVNGVGDKLEIKCQHNIIFYKSIGKLLRGQWCPCVSDSKSEKIVRSFFEQLFKCAFPKSRPIWLKNKTGYIMELDGYCIKLKLAFEHNGWQHYKIVDKYKMNESMLKEMQDRDALKQKLCKENGITLIIIEELFRNIKLNDLKEVIKQKCIEAGVQIPADYDEIKVNPYAAFDINISKEKVALLDNYLLGKGGELLTRECFSDYDDIICKCDKEHIWTTTYRRLITDEYWCPICSPTHKKNFYELKNQVEKTDFILLSSEDEYENSHSVIKLQCNKCNGKFKKTHRNFTRTPKCPYCEPSPFIYSNEIYDINKKDNL